MSKLIKHQFFIAQPVETVWEYLTQPQLIAQWLMPNDFKLELNHKFQFKTKPKFPIGFDGTVYCQVLEFAPMAKLVYSWKGGMDKDNPSLNSVVTWTLIAENGGTILSLEHKGFSGLKNYIPYFIMNKGWLKIGKRLASGINTNASKYQLTE